LGSNEYISDAYSNISIWVSDTIVGTSGSTELVNNGLVAPSCSQSTTSNMLGKKNKNDCNEFTTEEVNTNC
jgi:hypothetical protein